MVSIKSDRAIIELLIQLLVLDSRFFLCDHFSIGLALDALTIHVVAEAIGDRTQDKGDADQNAKSSHNRASPFLQKQVRLVLVPGASRWQL